MLTLYGAAPAFLTSSRLFDLESVQAPALHTTWDVPSLRPREPRTRAEVARALDRDQAARGELVERVIDVTRSTVAFAMMRRRREAAGRDVSTEVDDVVQDVLLLLWKNDAQVLRAWNPSRGASFDRFVAFVANREVSQTFRSRRRNPWFLEPIEHGRLECFLEPPVDPERRVVAADFLEATSAALQDQITDKGWSYYQALFVDQLDVDELAERHGTSADAVYAWRSRIRRALRLIRQELERPP